MQIKFQKKLKDYKYVLMFDLASKKTGVCLWDLKKHKPVYTEQIITSSEEELPVYGLKKVIGQCVNKILTQYSVGEKDILIYQEAMPTQLHGGMSTVQTFIALARSHAVLDLYAYEHDFDIYDYTGVYPISTHAYLKKLNEWDNKHKVDKTDIQQYVEQKYHKYELTPDEYDAIFLAQTFVDVKWNKDIDEEIRAVKRHKKELKLQYALEQCDERIKRLEELKV